jgi:hypothetical protein
MAQPIAKLSINLVGQNSLDLRKSLASRITASYQNIHGTLRTVMADNVVVTVRVPKPLAQRVQELALSRDETVSQVIRRSLRGYVADEPKNDAGGKTV